MKETEPKEISELTADDKRQLQEKLVENVHTELELKESYFLLLISSTIIATLGLITNSSVVVIGAMIISPLFWPIMGVTISIITTRRHLTTKSFLALGASIVTVILISFLVTLITPFSGITDEIAVRISPTLLDLFIALAVSVIGVAAVYYPKISTTATGVAMSIALLPPLCVSGIGLALGSPDIFLKSFLLFGANTGAIIVAGVVTLYVLNFRPRKKEEQERLWIGFLLSLVFLIILAVPLTIYLFETITNNKIKIELHKELTYQLENISEDVIIDKIEVSTLPLFGDEVDLEATILLPEGVFLTYTQQNNIVKGLSQKIDRTVDLRLNIVNTLLLRREEDETVQKIRSDVEAFIENELTTKYVNVSLVSLNVSFPENFDQNSDEPIKITLEVKDFGNSSLDFEVKQQLEDSIAYQLRKNVNLNIELVPIKKLEQPDQVAKIRSELESLLRLDLSLILSDSSLGDVTIELFSDEQHGEYLNVKAQVFTPIGSNISIKQKKLIESHLFSEFDKKVNLSIVLIEAKYL